MKKRLTRFTAVLLVVLLILGVFDASIVSVSAQGVGNGGAFGCTIEDVDSLPETADNYQIPMIYPISIDDFDESDYYSFYDPEDGYDLPLPADPEGRYISVISDYDSLSFFKYIPEKDTTIRFYSFSYRDTLGYIYDEDFNILWEDDSSGDDENFLIEAKVNAGKTYYLASGLNDSYHGWFDVVVVESDEYTFDDVKSIEFISDIDTVFRGETADSDDISARVVFNDDKQIILHLKGNNYQNADTETERNTIHNIEIVLASHTSFVYREEIDTYTITPRLEFRGKVFENDVIIPKTEAPIESLEVIGGDIEVCCVEKNLSMITDDENQSLTPYAGFSDIFPTDIKVNLNNGTSKLLSGYITSVEDYGERSITYAVDKRFFTELGYNAPAPLLSISADRAMEEWTVDNTYPLTIRFLNGTEGYHVSVVEPGSMEQVITTGFDFSGQIKPEHTIRRYRFEAPEDGKYVFDAYCGFRSRSCLFDESGTLLKSTMNSDSMPFSAERGEIYYIYVACTFSQYYGDYAHFSLNKYAPPTIEAVDIGHNEQKKVMVNAESVTYLRFIPEKDVKIRFFSIGDEDTYGYLYDEYLQMLLSDDDSGYEYNCKIETTLTGGKTYYFAIRFYDEDYEGEVEVVLEDTVKTISLGDSCPINFSDGYSEQLFRFVPEENVMVCFYTDSDYDTYGCIYDENMHELVRSDNSYNDFRIEYSLQGGNTYYLAAGLSFAGQECTVNVKLSKKTYSSINLGETVEAVIENPSQQIDYRLIPEEDTWVYIKCTADSNVISEIYDANMVHLGSFGYDGYAEWSDYPVKLEEGETYYISTRFADESETGSIFLKPVDFSTLVTDIRLSEQTEAVITTPGEKKYYRFVPEENIRIRFSSECSGSYMYCYLYDENMLELYSSGSYESLRFEFNLEKGKTYYFMTQLSDDSEDSYFVRLDDITFRYTDIGIGEQKTVDVNYPEEAKIFRFVPEEDMFVRFYPTSQYVASVEVLDENKNTLPSSYEWIDGKPSILCKLYAGQTYYFSAIAMNQENIDSITVKLEDSSSAISDIGLGETKEIETAASGRKPYFRFVPDENMRIRFYSEPVQSYVIGEIYDERMNLLYSTGSGNGLSIDYYLESGNTYYFVSYISAGFSEESYTVRLVDVSFRSSQINIGDTVEALIDYPGEEKFFCYEPQEDVIACFSSECGFDGTDNTLLDENMNLICSNNHWTGQMNRIVFRLSKGKRYYFKSILSDYEKTGNISVTLGVIAPGDADGDGQICILDATLIQKQLAHLASESAITVAAEVDGDNIITIFDVLRIQRYLAELCNLDGSTPYVKQN